MTIEINRFLALTMALATGAMAATGCVVTDDDPADTDDVTEEGGAGNEGGNVGYTDGSAKWVDVRQLKPHLASNGTEYYW